MPEKKTIRICGGLFYEQLVMKKRPAGDPHSRISGKADKITEKDLLKGLNVVCRPGEYYYSDNFGTVASRYKSCQRVSSSELIFLDEKVIAAFDREVRTSYRRPLERMAEYADRYLFSDEQTHMDELAASLFDILRLDSGIDDSFPLYALPTNNPVAKKDLAGREDVYLPALLLGIWHYIVVNRRENEIGAATYEICHGEKGSDPKTGGRKYTGTFGKGIDHKINAGMDINKYVRKNNEAATDNGNDTTPLPEDESSKKQGRNADEAKGRDSHGGGNTVNNNLTIIGTNYGTINF